MRPPLYKVLVFLLGSLLLGPALADAVPPIGGEAPVSVTLEPIGAAAETMLDANHARGALRKLRITVQNWTVGPLAGLEMTLGGVNATIVEAPGLSAEAAIHRFVLPPFGAGKTATFIATIRLDRPAAVPALADIRAGIEADVNLDLWVSRAALGWRVVDCPAAYHGALAELHSGLAGLDRAIDIASDRDPSLPARFLFRDAAGKPDRDEAEALRLAGLIASRRGSDPYIAARDTRWFLSQIYRDLDEYLGQDENPAICTGAGNVVAFLDKYAERLRDHDDKIGEAVKPLRDRAVETIATAWRAFGKDTSPPALIGPETVVPVLTDLIAAARAADLAKQAEAEAAKRQKALDAGLAEAPAPLEKPEPAEAAETGAETPADPAETPAAEAEPVPQDMIAAPPRPLPNPRPNPFGLLQRAAAMTTGRNPDIADREIRDQFTSAMTAIERYLYISLGKRQTAGVRDRLDATFSGILSASESYCTCVK